VEIMVALAISLFLLSGVLYAYLSNRTTYVFNEEMSRLQENGRMVMNMLENEIRRASHVGCVRLDKVRGNGLDTLKTNLERGLDANKLADLSATGITVAAVNNFELRIFGSSGYDMELTDDVPDGGNTINMVANVVGAQTGDGDYFLIGNCSEADLFKASTVTGQFADTTSITLGSAPAGLPEYKKEESSVFWMGPSVDGAPWFIKDNGRKDIAGRSILALVRGVEGAAFGSTPIEIVEGVEAFRVCVGSDPSRTGAISGKYVRADSIPSGSDDWKDVTAVQVDLVLVSQMPNVLDEAKSLTFDLCGGADPYVSPEDHRLRKLFSTTVMLRNKIP
jgi:type IV pilus assembly protein PilW